MDDNLPEYLLVDLFRFSHKKSVELGPVLSVDWLVCRVGALMLNNGRRVDKTPYGLFDERHCFVELADALAANSPPQQNQEQELAG